VINFPTTPRTHFLDIRLLGIYSSIVLLSSCAFLKPTQTGIGEAISWESVEGWHQDSHAEIWPALQNNCAVLSKRKAWDAICKEVDTIEKPDDSFARQFIENWFVPHPLYSDEGKRSGLITGYYEPLLFGSMVPDNRYRFPLYQQPESLLIVDLGSLYPDLKDMRLRGRMVGNRIVPFYSREEIEADRDLLAGQELLWLDDRDAAFFLHIQGSGRVQLPDGKIIGVGYSNQNGHPYVAIGRILLKQGELEREEISLFSIRQWLRDHPEKAVKLLNENPSYIFFVLRDAPEQGPIGSLNTPLTAQRSIAIDPKFVQLGTPIWLSTNYPGQPDREYQRLVIAQDTGGAIKGTLRADLFWGHGDLAEQSAGVMKEQGSMVILLPKPVKSGG
jgi:membrane-bound lytic murein transglycosylase A